ncbi:MAG: DUF5131 family protein [Clostridiales bacterium]|nr:DUF5131 family protein [Clostridiales bacterium]
MSMWKPWRGCKRCSEGCLHCYIHKGDAKRGVDTSLIVRTEEFYKPVERLKNGSYKLKPGLVYTCFSSDFLLEEADAWRGECWQMMKQRPDCTFLFLTKRIERFMDCIPPDWGDGYENVVVCCTVENQENADRKLAVFQSLPIRHKCITAQPLIGPIDLERYLAQVELVTVGGESDRDARPLDYDWVLDIRAQCMRQHVSFEFRQCGTHLIKDGTMYKLQTRDLCSQARKANINYQADADAAQG